MTNTAAEWRRQFKEEEAEIIKNMKEEFRTMLLESENRLANRLADLIKGLLQQYEDPPPPVSFPPSPPPTRPPQPPPTQPPAVPTTQPHQPPLSFSSPVASSAGVKNVEGNAKNAKASSPETQSRDYDVVRETQFLLEDQVTVKNVGENSKLANDGGKRDHTAIPNSSPSFSDFPTMKVASVGNLNLRKVCQSPISGHNQDRILPPTKEPGFRQWDPGDEDEEDATGLSP